MIRFGILLCVLGLLVGCGGSSKQASEASPLFAPQVFDGMDARTRFRMKQYLLQGYLLYKKHCANCHGNQGEGLRKLYPSLLESTRSNAQMACLIRYGTSEPKGTAFVPTMPASQLKPIQIAEIITFVQNAWGRTYGMAPVKEIQPVLDSCRVNAADSALRAR